MRKPTDEEKKLRDQLRHLLGHCGALYMGDPYGVAVNEHERIMLKTRLLIEETAWMDEPEDSTERLWELAELSRLLIDPLEA